MTDPTGASAAPPPSPAAMPAPPSSAGTSGFVYADVPNRAIAYIIDLIIVAILTAIVGAILTAVGLSSGTLAPGTLNYTINPLGLIVNAILGALISAGYFVYTWTSMRATLGMRVLGMQIGNAGDGKTLTMDQGIRRWLVIALPGLLSQVLFVLPTIGALIGLLSIIWFFYLLWTTAKSPTKQGYHDTFANTQVVKAARSA
jgi:uncharacterized RDD family membrane protein YckC